MGFVVSMRGPSGLKMVWHKLFHCPTFWLVKPAFQCPICGKRYRCYWDGNDTDRGINLCDECAAPTRGDKDAD
jgi:hypothetical protein